MNILSIYKVRFYKKVISGREYKWIDCVDESIMSFLIHSCKRVYSVDQVLDGINAVINGTHPLFSTTTEALEIVVITQSLTKFYEELDYYDNPNNEPNFQLPTAHFKVILEAWRNYLQS